MVKLVPVPTIRFKLSPAVVAIVPVAEVKEDEPIVLNTSKLELYSTAFKVEALLSKYTYATSPSAKELKSSCD